MNYSTTEKNTGMTWIDGKPIYRKTINVGTLPNASVKRVNINVSTLKNVLDIRGVAWLSIGLTIPLPYVNPANSVYQVEVYVNESKQVVIQTGDNKSNYTNSYVTILYTKTTD